MDADTDGVGATTPEEVVQAFKSKVPWGTGYVGFQAVPSAMGHRRGVASWHRHGRPWHLQGDAGPPPELFSNIELDAFAQQFLSLRTWMQGIEAVAFGHEFFVPERFLVQALGLDGQPVGQRFFIPAGQVDVSRWPPATFLNCQ